MTRRLKHNAVVGETTVTRLSKSGEAETWLIVDTSCQANDPDIRGIVSEALSVLSADPDIDGVDICSTKAL